ncbi:MAG: AbrB/MazE/SpoVT family DNA-binding domain-containing protein [Chloroflexota bacterium]
MQALSTISPKYQINIPLEIRKQFRLEPGQKIMFVPYEKSIRLVIVPPVREGLGMFKGINTDSIRQEKDDEH